jgi:hypothetical protein
MDGDWGMVQVLPGAALVLLLVFLPLMTVLQLFLNYCLVL